MADRKTNGGGASASSSGTNLLFSSSATEFSFNVPFIPVTQAAASPASLLLPGGSESRALGGQCVLRGGWDRNVAFSGPLFRVSSGQLPEGQGLCDPGGGALLLVQGTPVIAQVFVEHPLVCWVLAGNAAGFDSYPLLEYHKLSSYWETPVMGQDTI